jgi:CNT family concentrative nucleoside transporter
MDIYNLVSFAGIFILLGLAWLLSSNRRNVNYRVIIWALVLQFVFSSFYFPDPRWSKSFSILKRHSSAGLRLGLCRG